MARGLVPVAKLPAPLRAAALAAVKVSKNSYCPYSGFSVGAALVHADGSVTPGCNWENCTFQATCAERCAIVKANSEGKRGAVAVAIYGKILEATVDAEDPTTVSPCGLCRQHLNEVGQLANTDMQVVLVTRDTKNVAVWKLSELLPQDFGPQDFGLSLDKWAPKTGAQSTAAVRATASQKKAPSTPAATKAKAAAKPAGKKKQTAAKRK